ncbi:MAG: DUF1906 domain-containing protein [Nakamurella sp.]
MTKRISRTIATAALSIAAMIVTMTAAPGASAAEVGTVASSPSLTTTPATDASQAASEASQTMGGGLGTLDSGPASRKFAAPSVNTGGGNMFDTCDTPSVDTMRAWLASPYRTVGIYIGGTARGCKTQQNLTPSWITTTAAMGWSLVPTYVGLQAPCTVYTKKISLSESAAASQGRAAALDAIVQMRSLGIGANIPIYYDMENYSVSNGPCSVAVRSFTSSWTATLHANGYLSGIYGSASSMIHHIQAWTTQGGYNAPDNVWFARWNGVATADEPELLPTAWAGSRIHQFAGGHQETWGGVSINIDSNYVQSFTTAPSYVSTLTPQIVWDSKIANVGTTPVPVGIAGSGGVPSNASAVVLNVQVANPTGGGNLIVEPYRGSTNLATQQFQQGQYVSTTVVVPVSRKLVQFRTTAAKVRLIVSTTGYLTTTGTDGIQAVSPSILWDSKSTRVGTAPLALGVRGTGSIPDDATAAILNVQVVDPTASGQLIVEPHGAPTNVGTQQFTKGRNISATVLVRFQDAAIQFRLSTGNARIIVSVLGYLSPSAQGMLTATSPTLLFDSRSATISPTPTGLAVAGRNGIPANATAALVNVEVANPAAAGQLVVEPYGYRSNAGVQQFIKGQSISTTVLVPLRNGVMQLRVSAGKARLIVTGLGYVTPQSAPPVGGPGNGGD